MELKTEAFNNNWNNFCSKKDEIFGNEFQKPVADKFISTYLQGIK